MGTNQLGNTISRLLRERGMKPSQLANEAKIDPSQLSKIIVGKSFPSLDSLARIADVLGVSAGCLLDGTTTAADELTQGLQKKPELRVALRSIQELDDKEQEKVLNILNQVISFIDRAEDSAD